MNMALSCEVRKRKFIKSYYGILVTAVCRHRWSGGIAESYETLFYVSKSEIYLRNI